MKENVYMYYFDDQGYGHLCKIVLFSRILRTHFNVIVLCHKGFEKYFPEDIGFISLPYGGLFDEKSVSERLIFIQRIILEFPPNIFLIDFFPFGKYHLRHEIQYILSATKEQKGKVYTFMRDLYCGEKVFSDEEYAEYYQNFQDQYKISIINELQKTGEEILRYLRNGGKGRFFRINVMLEFLLSQNKIDGILVFGDEKIHKLQEEFILTEQQKKKFVYFGYILNSLGERKTLGRKSTKKIVVSSGGNITSKKDFLKLLLILARFEEYKIDVFLGDFVEIHYKDFLISHFGNNQNIHFFNFISDFQDRLKEYDFYFGFGGYGTFLDLVSEGIPSWIIPNYDDGDYIYRKGEQENRIKILGQRTNIQLLESISFLAIKKALHTVLGDEISYDIRTIKSQEILDFFRKTLI